MQRTGMQTSDNSLCVWCVCVCVRPCARACLMPCTSLSLLQTSRFLLRCNYTGPDGAFVPIQYNGTTHFQWAMSDLTGKPHRLPALFM